eukprot:scaffold1060_cov246-Pinguiococcus_pyrenoidosus.AAC.8
MLLSRTTRHQNKCLPPKCSSCKNHDQRHRTSRQKGTILEAVQPVLALQVSLVLRGRRSSILLAQRQLAPGRLIVIDETQPDE